MDASQTSASSDRKCSVRRIRPLSQSLPASRKQAPKNVCFVDYHDRVQEFANPEFCSTDQSVRKQVWYTSLEIRAIKQANLIACQRSQETEQEDCSRGLEHLLEGETKRRQRIHDFVASVLKLQAERQRKGKSSTGEAIAVFARTASRGDRRRAQKVGKQDHHANPFARRKPDRPSSIRKLMPRLRSRRSTASLEDQGNGSSHKGIQRNHSGNDGGFQKRRSMMLRMSNKAAALSNTSVGNSSRSLQSTTSSTESSHGSSSFTQVSSTAFAVEVGTAAS